MEKWSAQTHGEGNSQIVYMWDPDCVFIQSKTGKASILSK